MLKKYSIIYSLLLLSLCLKAQSHTPGHYGVEDGLPNNNVIDITQDGQGFIWIATESGLSRFDGRNFTAYTKNNSDIVSNALNTLLYVREDNYGLVLNVKELVSSILFLRLLQTLQL